MNSQAVKHTPIEWAEKACEALMAKFEPERLPPDRFHYHQGVFLSGMEKTWRETGKKKYLDYIKGWVDSQVQPDGSIKKFNPDELDDIQPGVLLFNLYEQTGDERYKKALHTLVPLLKSWKTNPSGGFWHKEHYPNQMWLDGLYMAGPIAVMYGKEFGESKYFDLMAYQAILMEKHTKDPKTGLLYHGWDETKEAAWADPATGLAPEFWGRAIGWYPVALLEMFEYMPENHKDKAKLVEILQDLLIALPKFQDEATGLWYQVVDKGDRPDNWLENSCTALYVHAIAKAVRFGYLDPKYMEYAWKGYQGVVDTLTFDENGRVVIGNICIGTGIGDYAHYIARPTSENDLHGAGAFILMCAEMSLAKQAK
ncbi:glycoside hydrolase family 88/105 protein [Cohnella thailandensis]|uniref:Glycoside hydrolase family 88 protein n=1 Tax=Cohnella thailandensis TaxID=557557 RepID=A0A841SYX8_9BACL|nr:glycoside hydrolase family 88 protein [Cohnella thailandensis]MBB6637114.1 glycoside hydrolase family 88 protein [Cohnella thailandensis]MBP1977069.1 unsaturated rhamnogalacturonyl hydrolase [Cohnella thailandensis]